MRYFRHRYFRHLPPLLRVASILGMLLPIASIALLGPALIAKALSFPLALSDFIRILGVAMNLNLLGLACAHVVNTYSERFRHPDRGTFPLNSWQNQARSLALLATLPLCALVLTLVIPLDSFAFLLASVTTILAAIILVVTYSWRIIGVIPSRPMRLPWAP